MCLCSLLEKLDINLKCTVRAINVPEALTNSNSGGEEIKFMIHSSVAGADSEAFQSNKCLSHVYNC